MLDTNVLLAAFATHGLCEALVTLSFRDHTVVLSPHILDEVERHYRGKFKADTEQVAEVLSFLRDHAELVEPSSVPEDAFADADDLPVLGTAVAGRAQCIVTGDKRMLALGSYADIPLYSPRQFYERLRA